VERFIFCVQAGWMVVQTISRVFSHQTITLLEYNTLGHVFTTFVIYLLWWNKPSNVNHLTFVQGQGMEAL
jgi:flagellar biosynthesis protein FlhB